MGIESARVCCRYWHGHGSWSMATPRSWPAVSHRCRICPERPDANDPASNLVAFDFTVLAPGWIGPKARGILRLALDGFQHPNRILQRNATSFGIARFRCGALDTPLNRGASLLRAGLIRARPAYPTCPRDRKHSRSAFEAWPTLRSVAIHTHTEL